MTARAWKRALPLALSALVTVLLLGRSTPAVAASPQDTAGQLLADRYSPVVRLQQDSSRCEDGEQFQPTDVEAVLGDQQVALRGPWRPPDLVKTQPRDKDLGLGYPAHFLDFPGDPLRPGCDYAEWSARINAVHPATVYAHVATDPEFPGQISLEYWFFYVFNDYNNTHEGDWESIQLVFDAPTPTAALATHPTAVGFIWFAASRTRWSDANPLPARKRRAWGQAVVAALRLFRLRPILFAGFAAAFVVLSLLTVILTEFQVARRDAPTDLGAPTENAPGLWASLVALAVTILTIATYGALLATVTTTLDQLDRGAPVTAALTMREVASNRRPLARAAVQYWVVFTVLALFIATIPVAIYYAVSRAFAVPIVVAERCSGRTALRRSRLLVRGRWWRTAVPLAIIVGLGLAAGPIAGIVLLLATDLAPTLINPVTSLMFALAMPITAAAVAYLYFDRAAFARESPGSGELPAAGRTYSRDGDGSVEHDLSPMRSDS
jgi:hypothetical protein